MAKNPAVLATGTATTLAKGLHLLSAILADEGRSSLSAIAAAIDMPLPTAHRLALTLEKEGFLHRVRKGCYHSGPALSLVHDKAAPEFQAAARLRRPLARLAQAHRAFVHFGVYEDSMVTYLVKEKGTERELFTIEHMQLEAYCSAVGKVLLAALSPAELDAYLANGPFVALTPHTLTDPAAIRHELDGVRDTGVAFDRFEIRNDLFCIAVPVRDADGAVLGGISISLLGDAPDTATVARLRTALRRIAAAAQRTGAEAMVAP